MSYRRKRRRKSRRKFKFKFKPDSTVTALNEGFSDGQHRREKTKKYKAGSAKMIQYERGYIAGMRALSSQEVRPR
jgi:hypothetical protein